MRYAAPADVSAINLSSGPLVVIDGFVEAPDDAAQGDLGGLATYGFCPAPREADAAAPAAKVAEDPAHGEPAHEEPPLAVGDARRIEG